MLPVSWQYYKVPGCSSTNIPLKFLLRLRIRKRFCKTLGTSVINSQLSQLSLKILWLQSLFFLRFKKNNLYFPRKVSLSETMMEAPRLSNKSVLVNLNINKSNRMSMCLSVCLQRRICIVMILLASHRCRDDLSFSGGGD